MVYLKYHEAKIFPLQLDKEKREIYYSIVMDRQEKVYKIRLPESVSLELFKELSKVLLCLYALGLSTICRKVTVLEMISSVELDFINRIKMMFFSALCNSSGHYLMAPPCIGEVEFPVLDEVTALGSFIFAPTVYDKVGIGYSGGKESLLSRLLIEQAGYETFNVFINEGMASEGAKSFFGLKNEDFIFYDNHPWDEVFTVIGLDHWYPSTSLARLIIASIYSVCRGVGYVVSGNEYTCSEMYFTGAEGTVHFGTAFGQSIFAMKELQRYFKLKGISVKIFSPVLPMSLFLEELYLYKYYPKEAEEQLSCFNHFEDHGVLHTCGVCPKCELLNVMLVVINRNYQAFGFEKPIKSKFIRRANVSELPKEIKTLINEEEAEFLSNALHGNLDLNSPLLKLRFDTLHPRRDIPAEVLQLMEEKAIW